MKDSMSWFCVSVWVSFGLCSCQLSLGTTSFCQCSAYMLRTRRFSQSAHAITDTKDREVEIGGAGKIIKRSQSVTHRLLSVTARGRIKSVQALRRHMTTLSLSNTHSHTIWIGISVYEQYRSVKRSMHRHSLLNPYIYPETDGSRSGTARD